LKKTFYPKIIFPTIKLIFIVGFLVLLFSIIVKFFEKLNSRIDFDFILPALIFILFIGFFTFQFGYIFCFYFKWVSLCDNKIAIFELNKLKSITVDISEILGYSKSEVYFGKYVWKSKSIVIYFKSGKTSEILSCFVSGNDNFEKELKIRKVKYFGFEHFKTGWLFRVYRFNK
jgi:vacuolar-type H+-ATPase subunit I/STV1